MHGSKKKIFQVGPRDYFVWKGGGGLFFGKFYFVILNKFEFSEGGGEGSGAPPVF